MFTLLLALTIYVATAQAKVALSPTDLGFQLHNFLPAAEALPRSVGAETVPVPVRIDPTRLGVETVSRAAFVMDWRTGETLMRKNADQPYPIASITKLMTALVVMDAGTPLDRTVEVEQSDMRVGGIQYVLPGEVISVGDLLHASLIASANGATVTLSRSAGLSPEEFVGRMNSLAQGIGMSESSFVEPTGLNTGNVASARDVALLVRRVLQDDTLRGILLTDEYSFDAVSGLHHRLRSTDELLNTWVSRPPLSFLGGKTGYLEEAGYCFGAAAENQDGHRIIAVVLGAPSKQARFDDVGAMIFWSFDAFEWQTGT
ncbi:MAG: serine hydrolase [bacterium]